MLGMASVLVTRALSLSFNKDNETWKPATQASSFCGTRQEKSSPMPSEKDRENLFNAYREAVLPTASTPTPPWNFDTDGAESILSGHSKLTKQADYDPHLSPFEPHHKLELRYPCLDLLARDGSEICRLHMPHKAAERYQPLPLIQDKTIWANAGRDKLPEAMFYTLHKAVAAIPGVSRKGARCDDLAVDVREVTKYVGNTVLYVVICKSPAQWGPQILVRRDTYFRFRNDQREAERKEHNLSLDTFLSKKHDARWYFDLVDLIEMRTERAARHVQLLLYSWSRDKSKHGGIERGAPALWEKFCCAWKPPRTPDYSASLNECLREVKKTGAFILIGRPCKICQKPFKIPHHAPSTMTCCQKTITKTCLLNYLHASYPRNPIPPFKPPTCPYCSTPLFNDSTLLNLRLHITLEQIYIPPPLHTPWENFEISCSDLDFQHPSSSANQTIKINPTLLLATFHHLLTSSTPSHPEPHFQLPVMPEFKFYETTLFYHIRCLSSLQTTPSHLYAFLQEQIRLAFRQKFYEADLHVFLPPGIQRRSWIGDQEIQRRVWVRDGFEEFTGRVVRRMFKFVEARGCRERHGRGGLFHKHADGVRVYYDLGFAEGLEEVEEGVKVWQESKTGRSYVRDFYAFGK